MRKLKYDVAGLTDAGLVKEVNEDSYMYKVVDAQEYDAGICAVADGVGGLAGGAVASARAIWTVNQWWENDFRKYYHDRAALIQSMGDLLVRINAEILELSKRQGVKMATTLTVFLLYKNEGIIAHSGDCRIYRISGGVFRTQCEILTRDQSRVVDVPVQGQMVQRSVLTECLGYRDRINPYYTAYPINRNEIYIICSDGAYKTLANEDLKQCVARNKDMPSVCEAIIEAVKNRHETDNVTVVAVRIHS